MDAVSFDYMVGEYQEKRLEAYEEVQNNRSPPSVRKENSEPEVEENQSDTEQYRYEEEIGSGSTVPVNEVNLSEAVSNISERVAKVESDSNKSSIDSVHSNSSRGHASIYNPSSISPSIKYDRDNPNQHLVAIFGREFDMPETVACSLQKLATAEVSPPASPSIKFVPFTLKRKTLLKGTFDSSELVNHDLICMCYNASEARILLTGTDGFYSSLLHHTESTLGPNKVSFIITKYRQPGTNEEDTVLICPPLKTRLAKQEALVSYLDNNQILSWTYSPDAMHLERLKELAKLERNPHSFFDQSCVCL